MKHSVTGDRIGYSGDIRSSQYGLRNIVSEHPRRLGKIRDGVITSSITEALREVTHGEKVSLSMLCSRCYRAYDSKPMIKHNASPKELAT